MGAPGSFAPVVRLRFLTTLVFATAFAALALADVGVVLKLLGPVTGGVTTMGGVESGVAGVVLIFTINRFCFNKRLHNAVTTAAAVKVVVTLCYVFGGVALLHLVYG